MKTYEKPRLIALSLSSEDMLCSGCENRYTGVFDWWDDNHDGMLSDEEVNNHGLFGLSELSESQCSGVQIEFYCKFTSTETNVFNS